MTSRALDLCYAGGVNQNQCRQQIVDYITLNAKPPDKLSHQVRLYDLAQRLAEGKAYDDDVVFAGAWMHDLGVFIGHRPEDPVALANWDHVAYAIEETPKILRRLGFPEAKLPHVLEVIRTHLPTATPTSFEGILLRDADILEQLGATGILRVVSKIGRDTRFAVFNDALRVLQRNMVDLPPQIRLASAQRLAEDRVTAMRNFLAAATAEIGNK
jgi:uncharacterized protein